MIKPWKWADPSMKDPGRKRKMRWKKDKQQNAIRIDYLETTLARLSKWRKWKKRNIKRVGTWNITSWNKHDQEDIMELENKNTDICTITETKKKGKGTVTNNNYDLLYSGIEKNTTANK